MPNIVPHSQLTSATAEGGRPSGTRVTRIRRENQRRRARKGVAPSLVALGSRVGSPARNLPKRRWLPDGRPNAGSVRRVTPPGAVEQNGSKVNAISSRHVEQDWLDQHHAAYAGAWVALDGTRLVAHGSSAQQVLDAAKSEGCEQPLIVHIPSEPPLPFGGW
jgi:hypothetical protein